MKRCESHVRLRRQFSVLLWLIGLAALTGLTTGCQSVSYYSQAVHGEFEILTHREPIPKLIADPKTPANLKTKLELILKLRQFAKSELKLEPDGHYLDYVDLHRRFVVWTVHATPELSLEPKTWWYPVVCSLKYRG
jgi:predicted aminopeptidase